MKLKINELEIPKDDPFANDKLTRKIVAEPMTQLISNLSIPFVLGIDSSWGSGKTTFIKMWRQFLLNKNIPSIYYNAWENDFSSSALISLLGEFDKGLSELKLSKSRRKRIDEKLNKAKDVGVDLLKRGIPIAIKVLSSSIIDVNKAAETAISELGENYSKDLIEKYEKSKESIAEFRKMLTNFVQEMTKATSTYSDKPLVVFIDELDRCRPDFALEVLEKSKHLFNIQGIIFIYSFDKKQLGFSIKSLYGHEMDVDGYLRRFFDLVYKLPSPNIENYVSYLFSSYDLVSFFNTRDVDRYEYDNIQKTITHLFKIFNFSLRTQEQIFTQLVFALLSTPPRNYIYPFALGTLICLKSVNEDLYTRYINNSSSAKEVIDYIKSKPGGVAFLNEIVGIINEAYIIGLNPIKNAHGEYDFPLLIEYKKNAEKDSSSAIEKDRFNRIERIIRNETFWNPPETLSYIVKKIDFIENIHEENIKTLG